MLDGYPILEGPVGVLGHQLNPSLGSSVSSPPSMAFYGGPTNGALMQHPQVRRDMLPPQQLGVQQCNPAAAASAALEARAKAEMLMALHWASRDVSQEFIPPPAAIPSAGMLPPTSLPFGQPAAGSIPPHSRPEEAVPPLVPDVFLPPGMTLRLAAAGLPLTSQSTADNQNAQSTEQLQAQPNGGGNHLSSNGNHRQGSAQNGNNNNNNNSSNNSNSGSNASSSNHHRQPAKQQQQQQQQPGNSKKGNGGSKQQGSKAGGNNHESHRDTLRRHLEDLKNENPRCIFITRRINKLGFRSRLPLEQHFSHYGRVARVLVAHSKVKPLQQASPVQRTRPGNFGLIVMDSPEAVQRILAEGPEQVVAGVQIQVQLFERPNIEAEESEEKDSVSKADPPALTAASIATAAPAVAAAVAAAPSSDSAKMWHFDPSSAEGHAHAQAMAHEDLNRAALPPAVSGGSSSSSSSSPATNTSASASVSSQLTLVLKELSRIARESDQLHYLTREQSLHTASLAQWAQHSLRTLEEQCQQKFEELSKASCGLPQCHPLLKVEPGASSQMLSGHALAAAAGMPMNEHLPAAQMVAQILQKLDATHQEQAPSPAATKDEASVKDSNARQAKWQPAVRKPCKTREAEGTQTAARVEPRDTLRSHLTQLSKEDPKSIFIARRINKLGFRSREVLRAHFSHYGEVCKVLVAHSKVKPFRDADGQLKTRPGGLGLVVMKNPAVVTKILAEGEEQLVAGHLIRVSAFEKPQVTYNGSTTASNNSNGSGISTAPGSNSNSNGSDSSSSTSQEKSEEGSEGGYEKSDDMVAGDIAEGGWEGSGSSGVVGSGDCGEDAGSADGGDGGSNDSWQSPKIKQ